MGRHKSKRALERAEYDPLDPAKQHAPVSAGLLVSGYLDGKAKAGASDASRALMTWRRIAGRRAASHTVAVWLNRPKVEGHLPELVVYLDGNALMADLTTNALLYEERLAYAGLPVERVRFRLSRKAGQASAPAGAAHASEAPAPAAPEPLPPLAPAEEARVDAACAQLPPRLREAASEAMKLSLRRKKSEGTN